MEHKKLTKDVFTQIFLEETAPARAYLAEEIKKIGDPMKVDLNKNDKLGDKDAALVHKSKSKTEYKKGPATVVKSGNTSEGDPVEDVKLNQQPSKGGSDEKASTAVAVKAGAEKGGNSVTSGQAKANFTSKTGGPKKSVSDPFVDEASDKMNQNDKLIDDGAKTFVDAGSEKGGTDVTAGQHKATWKERAPKSDNEKRIADAIQLKEKYTATELRDLIISESKKRARREMFEISLEQLRKENDKLK